MENVRIILLAERSISNLTVDKSLNYVAVLMMDNGIKKYRIRKRHGLTTTQVQGIKKSSMCKILV
jgi:hypothetical protein